MDQNRTAGTRCPDWGCCCDHGRECCADAIDGGGNYDHLGERGGCRQLRDPCTGCTAEQRAARGTCPHCPYELAGL